MRLATRSQEAEKAAPTGTSRFLWRCDHQGNPRVIHHRHSGRVNERGKRPAFAFLASFQQPAHGVATSQRDAMPVFLTTDEERDVCDARTLGRGQRAARMTRLRL
jgi:hypothetical protein